MNNKTALSIDYSWLEALKETDRKLICYLAYNTDLVEMKHLTSSSLKNPFRNVSDIKERLERLTQEMLVDTIRSYWDKMMDDGSFRVYLDDYFTVNYYTLTQKPEWEKEFMAYLQGNSRTRKVLLNILEKAIAGENVTLLSDWYYAEIQQCLLPVAFDPVFRPVITNMPSILFVPLLSKLTDILIKNDMLDRDDCLEQLIEAKHDLAPSEQERLKSLRALYRYYAFGEYIPVNAPQEPAYWILKGVRAMHEKHYAEALEFFDKGLKLRNKVSQVKNIFDNFLDCYFLIMAYVREGSEASRKKLQQFLRKNEVNNRLNYQPAVILADTYLSEEQTPEKKWIENLLYKTPGFHFLGCLFARYFSIDTDEYPIDLKPVMNQPQMAVLRNELAAYLPMSETERKELQRIMGTPVLTSIFRKQPWENTLDLLLQDALQQQEPDAVNQRQIRLAYIIRNGYSVEMREQTLLKSGKWGSGKALSGIRYYEGPFELMDEQDKKLWSIVRNEYSYVRPEDIIPWLVGCDHIYAGAYAPFSPVTIEEEKPYLTIDRKKQGFVVNSNLTKRDFSGTPKKHIIRQLTDTHYVVIPLTDKQWNYYRRLLMQEEFPPEAESKLKEVLSQIGGTVEVHSDLLENGSTLEAVEGNSQLCLQVRQQRLGYEVAILIRPLPGGQKTYLPGKGAGIVFDETDGKRVQVNRNMSREQNNYKALAAFLDAELEIQINDSNLWLSLENMLGLLEYVTNNADTVYLEWPEGEKLSLRQAPDSGNWNVNLRTAGNWFEVEGEVRIDEQHVISMAQLLDLLAAGKSNYIRLNEKEYMQLGENLRKQLERLESLAVKERGKIKISQFNTPLLDKTVNGVLSVGCDKQLNELKNNITKSLKQEPPVPAMLQAELRDYQYEGFRWMVRQTGWGAGVCLADDMGLGKTVQTIAFLLHRAQQGPSLVVAPASVIPNWCSELNRFAPALKISVLNKSTDRKALIAEATDNEVVLSTYGLLVNEEESLTDKAWNVVCLDEAHTIKNRDTKMSKVTMQLQASARLILTGTPIQNHLGELWNLFSFINPGLLGSYEQFHTKFIAPIEGSNDKERQLQLKRIVQPFMLRRTKAEVIEELPEKMEITIPVELSSEEMAAYEVIRRKAKSMLEEENRVSVSTLAEITKLRQAACSIALTNKKWKGDTTKIQILLDQIDEIKTGQNRMLIFSQFTSFLELVRKKLDERHEPYLYLDGNVSLKQREMLVKRFQNGECPLFLISLKAGGLGLNLTGANYVIHLDPWWNPAIEQQATDRAYRIGQERNVTVYRLIAQHTIEEKIVRLHHSKRDLADSLLEGADLAGKLTEKELMDMLTEN